MTATTFRLIWQAKFPNAAQRATHGHEDCACLAGDDRASRSILRTSATFLSVVGLISTFLTLSIGLPSVAEPEWINGGKSRSSSHLIAGAPTSGEPEGSKSPDRSKQKTSATESDAGSAGENGGKLTGNADKSGSASPTTAKRNLWAENLSTVKSLNEKKDYVGLQKMLLPMAESGDKNAQYELSNLYFNGQGVPRDYSRSADWAEKSANSGHPGAQYMMGGFHLLGQGMTRDNERAMRWFRLAADQGHREAQFSLGMCYLRADSTPEDQATGLRWLEKGADAGSQGAQIALSQYYVRRDPALAFKWMSSAAATGSPIAGLMLGDYYHNGIGVSKDDTKAFEQWKKTAEQGSSEGQRSVGQAYREGIGTTPDLAKSFSWARKSAESGNAKGAYDVGQHYLRGIGVAANDEQAFTWFNRSATAGNPQAQNSLGALYLEGKGVKQDPREALKWFEKAASQRYEIAEQNAKMVKTQLNKGNTSKFSVKRTGMPMRLPDGYQ